MKTFQLDPNSWHYKLVMKDNYFYKNDCDEYGTDICTYSRKLIVRVCFLTVLSILALSLVISYISMFVWMYDSFIVGELLKGYGMAIPAQSVTICALFFIIVFLINKFMTYFLEKKNNFFYDLESKEKQPSIIKLAYRSWKDKYCVKLEVMKKE